MAGCSTTKVCSMSCTHRFFILEKQCHVPRVWFFLCCFGVQLSLLSSVRFLVLFLSLTHPLFSMQHGPARFARVKVCDSRRMSYSAPRPTAGQRQRQTQTQTHRAHSAPCTAVRGRHDGRRGQGVPAAIEGHRGRGHAHVCTRGRCACGVLLLF